MHHAVIYIADNFAAILDKLLPLKSSKFTLVILIC